MSAPLPGPALTDDLLRSIFRMFDADESGAIDAEECALALQAVGITDISVGEVERHFQLIGSTKTINQHEFSVLARKRYAASAPAVERHIFNSFDLNGTGDLSAEDLLAIAADLGQLVDPALMHDLVADVRRRYGSFGFPAWQAILAVRTAPVPRTQHTHRAPRLHASPALVFSPPGCPLLSRHPPAPTHPASARTPPPPTPPRQEEARFARRRGRRERALGIGMAGVRTHPYEIPLALDFENCPAITHH